MHGGVKRGAHAREVPMRLWFLNLHSLRWPLSTDQSSNSPTGQRRSDFVLLSAASIWFENWGSWDRV